MRKAYKALKTQDNCQASRIAAKPLKTKKVTLLAVSATFGRGAAVHLINGEHPMLVRGTKGPFFMKKPHPLVVGIVFTIGAMILLGAIANNPRVSPLWRHVATTAEGEIFEHVITGDLVKLVA